MGCAYFFAYASVKNGASKSGVLVISGRAFVVTTTPLSTQDVVEHCRALVANYKVPRQVAFLAALPRNAAGKVLKRQLREESR